MRGPEVTTRDGFLSLGLIRQRDKLAIQFNKSGSFALR